MTSTIKPRFSPHPDNSNVAKIRLVFSARLGQISSVITSSAIRGRHELDFHHAFQRIEIIFEHECFSCYFSLLRFYRSIICIHHRSMNMQSAFCGRFIVRVIFIFAFQPAIAAPCFAHAFFLVECNSHGCNPAARANKNIG